MLYWLNSFKNDLFDEEWFNLAETFCYFILSCKTITPNDINIFSTNHNSKVFV